MGWAGWAKSTECRGPEFKAKKFVREQPFTQLLRMAAYSVKLYEHQFDDWTVM